MLYDLLFMAVFLYTLQAIYAFFFEDKVEKYIYERAVESYEIYSKERDKLVEMIINNASEKEIKLQEELVKRLKKKLY